MWRQDVVPYRPGQWIPHNIMARTRFSYPDATSWPMPGSNAAKASRGSISLILTAIHGPCFKKR